MKKLALTLCLAALATTGLSACETYTSENQARTAGGIESTFRHEQMK